MDSQPETQQNNRARALIAICAMAALAILVVVIVATGGSSERDFADAPSECVDSWNADAQAKSTGIHNFTAHSYSSVQVAYASDDAAEISPSPVSGGGCIVVFAAQALDPEPVAAAEINLGDEWEPMSTKAELDRLAELQSNALAEANATLGSDGGVTPLD